MEYKYLSNIKDMLGITGGYQDKTLQGYVDEVIAYMVDAGVKKEVAEGQSAVGVVARGVSDLWNYGSGETKLSDYFKERVIQLAFRTEEKESDGV